jgi:Skp family chaperone for outer membrane proteins
LTNQANQQYIAAQQQGRQQVAEKQAQLFSAFQSSVAKVAADIARKRGATSAVAMTPALLWHDSDLDITGQVIDAMRKQNSDAVFPGGQ